VGAKVPRGSDSPGHRNESPAAATVIAMVGHGADVAGEHRFGQPSTYSLPPAVLAAHIRYLRRSGWQHWEIAERFTFDFGTCA
jgi:hypothetical protein